MCLKIHPPWSMPQETGRIGKLLLGEKSPYRLIGDHLFEKLTTKNYLLFRSGWHNANVNLANSMWMLVT